jgi:hypothetical protein
MGLDLKVTPYPDWLQANTEGVKFIEQISTEGDYPIDQVPQDVRDAMKASYVEIDPTAKVLEEKPE